MTYVFIRVNKFNKLISYQVLYLDCVNNSSQWAGKRLLTILVTKKLNQELYLNV